MPDRDAADERGTAFPGPGNQGGAENPLRTDDILVDTPNDPAARHVQGTDEGSTGKPRSLWSDAWHDLVRKPVFLIASLLILGVTLVAVAPGCSPTPTRSSATCSSATRPRRRGTRSATTGRAATSTPGCSTGRPSVSVGVLVTLGAVLLGGSVGAVAGFYGGLVDSLLSRITDVFFAIPLLLGAIVFLQAFPQRNVWTVVLALVVLGWTQIARIMRGAVISVKEADFVVAARALGASNMRILVRHVLPNSIAPVIVVATISLGIYIVAEATLSFLGIGLPPSTVSWGNDISDAQVSLRSAPHVLMYPAAALSITVLSFIMLGDAVRDALDPRLR
jgi:oligopeptide transport system permease protein